MKYFIKSLFIFSLAIPFGIASADTHDDATMEALEHSSSERYEHEIELPGKHDKDDHKDHHDKNRDDHKDSKDESRDDKEDGKDDSHEEKEDSKDEKEESSEEKEESSSDEKDHT